MKRYINTGEIKFSDQSEVLIADALGSCVAIILYDEESKNGGIAHCLLPGKSPESEKENKYKYIEDAVDQLLCIIRQRNISKRRVRAFLVGGGNVIKSKDDSICRENINSAISVLKDNHIRITAQSLGGTERRSVYFYPEHGLIKFTQGDKKEKVLWEVKNGKKSRKYVKK